ncbi:hypothetical protein [Nostoc sp. DedQUE09]|uniref:hypothetical protein n=1 Tax=Nostoc sp. DedQUE09 TaxID=3075394 RepID=UPI002AD1DA4B|nr:hypothetical protein [Nostoc sp. DedQUE09]MDZ7949860.1 hypothetical protein [Nostoc sp. DedQUE09]
MQAVVQQILNCLYRGITKRMCLRTKVLEMMMLQLAPILATQSGLQPSSRLKAPTIACIHHAREILLSCLENPPSLLELTAQAGVNYRALRGCFKRVFC